MKGVAASDVMFYLICVVDVKSTLRLSADKKLVMLSHFDRSKEICEATYGAVFSWD